MKHVLIMATSGIIATTGFVELFGESAASSPVAWAMVIAGVAGFGFAGRRRPKLSLETEE
jgi:hypothetical protein